MGLYLSFDYLSPVLNTLVIFTCLTQQFRLTIFRANSDIANFKMT